MGQRCIYRGVYEFAREQEGEGQGERVAVVDLTGGCAWNVRPEAGFVLSLPPLEVYYYSGVESPLGLSLRRLGLLWVWPR